MDAESFNANGLAWAVSRWNDEVRYRPLVNVHRRSLDDAWRQVIRYFGGDPDKLLGPSHDMLLMLEQESRAWKPRLAAGVAPTDGSPDLARCLTALVDQYWDLAYAEGKEDRQHDTPGGDAQRVRWEICRAIRQLADGVAGTLPDQPSEGSDAA